MSFNAQQKNESTKKHWFWYWCAYSNHRNQRTQTQATIRKNIGIYNNQWFYNGFRIQSIESIGLNVEALESTKTQVL